MAAYVGDAPVVVDNLLGTVGLNAGTSPGQLLTWDGNNWIAAAAATPHFTLNNVQPFQVVNFVIALQGVYPSRNSSNPLIAEIMLFGGNFAPRGWAQCDGQLLSISANSALFSILGTMYGGDGITTFGLPDLRGRVPMHHGSGPGLSNRNLGVKGGTETTGQ